MYYQNHHMAYAVIWSVMAKCLRSPAQHLTTIIFYSDLVCVFVFFSLSVLQKLTLINLEQSRPTDPSLRLMSASLLPETVDTVIDFLHDNKAALAACGLTCKTWLPSSRFHLFSRIELAMKSPARIRALTSLLSDQSHSHLKSIVRHLCLKSMSIDNASSAEIVKLTSCLPEITSLTLSISDLTDFSTHYFSVMFANLESVEGIELDRVLMLDLDQTLDLVYLFPSLKRLSVAMVNWYERPPNYSLPPLERLQYGPKFDFGAVVLAHQSFGDIAEWMLARDPIPSVQSFRANTFMPTAEENFTTNKLLYAVGNTLQQLTLSCRLSKDEADGEFLNRFHCVIVYRSCEIAGKNDIASLRQCKNLKTLEMLAITLTRAPYEYRVFWPTDVLENITSHQLEEIRFSFQSDTSGDGYDLFVSFDWEGIAKFLGRPQFGKLKLIFVKWGSKSSNSRFTEAEAFLREKLLPVGKQEILRIQFSSQKH